MKSDLKLQIYSRIYERAKWKSAARTTKNIPRLSGEGYFRTSSYLLKAAFVGLRLLYLAALHFLAEVLEQDPVIQDEHQRC